MSLPIYQRVAVTDAGDVIPGAEYTVINENTGVAAPIYSDRTGATLLSAPYFADSAGTIQFFIAQGTTFRVAASGGVGTYTDRYVYGVAEAVLVDASGNVNVDGTVTADGLTVDGASSSQQITFSRTVSSTGTGKIGSDVSQAMGLWGTDGTKVATFSQNKDISFYEDTGTTPKFFWDASSTRLILDGAEVSRSNNNYLLDIDNSAQSSNLATSGPFRVKGYYGESLVVTGAGNVGIGTSSPAYELDVNGQINIADGKNIRCEGHILIGKSTDDEIRVGSGNTTDILKLFAGGSERMRIDLGGNVSLGSTNAYSHRFFALATGASETVGLAVGANNTNVIRFYSSTLGTAGAVRVSAAGTSVSYNTSSDYRLKEDDVPMTGATERVKALRPINFAWKADGSRVDGFFAHELAEVVPEAASGTKDAMIDEEYEVTPAVYEDVTTPAVEAVLDEDGVVITEAVEESTESVLVTEAVMATRSVPDYQGIDQSKLVPLLTATIQELIARIEALESGA